ncbi:ABC transporter substrate-binding protein [Actinopolymorpha alba]|uniref:ABC transporter substrate-binding protein n=1 Tax=Actinopolymorpha alba TaxID=533267 RepID=UPI000366C8B4|nr:extracellular solute-binding protein [Actinopolymorpha alba]
MFSTNLVSDRGRPRLHRKAWVRLLSGVAALALAASACGGSGDGSSSDSSGDTVTITLEGPNQWNESGSSFGRPWEDLVAAFEKEEPTIKVKTVVLPLSSFSQTISTHLSAGTAPELVFNQAPHQPYMVTALDEYLQKPNPYIKSGPGSQRWIDVFRKRYYGTGNPASRNAEGKVEFVPFNLVGIGLFYNKEAFDKAGISAPFATFEDLIDGCGKLKAAGYTPLAMDRSDLGPGWTMSTISGMLLDTWVDRLNVYTVDGKPGKAASSTGQPVVAGKSVAKAVLSGELTTKAPEIVESHKLIKRMWDSCVDKNWSGNTEGLNGAVVGLRDFAGGKAGMAWGVNFGVSALKDVKFSFSSMPFPQITTDSTPVATDAPARFGASVGGTSYMIPSKVKGAKLQAAVKFLQFVSTPERIQPWLSATGGISAVEGSAGAGETKAFADGSWGDSIPLGIPGGPPGVTTLSLFEGWLLGTKNLQQQESYLQNLWIKGQRQAVKDNKWDKEPWAGRK